MVVFLSYKVDYKVEWVSIGPAKSLRNEILEIADGEDTCQSVSGSGLRDMYGTGSIGHTDMLWLLLTCTVCPNSHLSASPP